MTMITRKSPCPQQLRRWVGSNFRHKNTPSCLTALCRLKYHNRSLRREEQLSQQSSAKHSKRLDQHATCESHLALDLNWRPTFASRTVRARRSWLTKDAPFQRRRSCRTSHRRHLSSAASCSSLVHKTQGEVVTATQSYRTKEWHIDVLHDVVMDSRAGIVRNSCGPLCVTLFTSLYHLYVPFFDEGNLEDVNGP